MLFYVIDSYVMFVFLFLNYMVYDLLGENYFFMSILLRNVMVFLVNVLCCCFRLSVVI